MTGKFKQSTEHAILVNKGQGSLASPQTSACEHDQCPESTVGTASTFYCQTYYSF